MFADGVRQWVVCMTDIGKQNFLNKIKNIVIFLTAAAVISASIGRYAEDNFYIRVVVEYIAVFLAPLFAFVVGIWSKPKVHSEKPRWGSLGMLAGAYVLLKIITCIVAVYAYGDSLARAFLAGDQAWVFLAVVVWIMVARAMRRLKQTTAIVIGVALGLVVGFLPEVRLADAVSKVFVFLPFFLAGHYYGKETAAITSRRWLKVASFLVVILLLVLPMLLNMVHSGAYSGRVMPGDPVTKLAVRIAAYALSAFVSVLWFCAVPERRFLFTGYAQRAFQVFFWYRIVIGLWHRFNMSSIFNQIWAGNELLLYSIAMAVVMIFIALIPLPLFSRHMERINTGRWRLPDAGEPVLKRLKQHSFLFSELVKRDFKKKYKRTVLGMLWSVLSPLLTLLVMWLVFSQFFGRNNPHYVVYIFAGNLVYSYFRESTGEGMTSLVANSGIFTKVNVPKYMFVFSKNLTSLISFGLTLIVFFIFVAADGIPFTWKFILLFYPICCLVLFNIGVGLILSALFVFFKDIQYLWSVFTMLLMYMSAIFYNIDAYSETVQNLFLLNPVYVYIRYFRKIVIENTIPTLWFHLIAAGYAIFLFYLGFRMYKKNNTKFLYYV